MKKVEEIHYKEAKIVIYQKHIFGDYYYKTKLKNEKRLCFTEGFPYMFKKEAIEEARKYIDLNVEEVN